MSRTILRSLPNFRLMRHSEESVGKPIDLKEDAMSQPGNLIDEADIGSGEQEDAEQEELKEEIRKIQPQNVEPDPPPDNKPANT